MNPERQGAPESPKPLLELKAGVDYWDIEELHAKVIDKLADMDKLRDDLLLCGYDASLDTSDRKTTYALTLKETTSNIDRPSSSSVIPYEYALDALDDEGVPEVAVYDPDKFTHSNAEVDVYDLKEGYTLPDALILRVRLA